MLTNIRNRQGEVGFIGEKPDNPDLTFDLVYYDDMVLLTPSFYGIEDEVTLQKAITYPFIWRESGSATRRVLEEAASRKGIQAAQFNIVASFNDMLPIIRSVEQGLGVTIISSRIARDLQSDKLKIVKISDVQIEREIYMVTHPLACLSPVAEKFVEFVRERQQRQATKR